MTRFGKVVLFVSIVLIASLSANVFMAVKVSRLTEENLKYSEDLRNSNVHSLIQVVENKMFGAKIDKLKNEKERIIAEKNSMDRYIEVLESAEISIEEQALREFYKRETGNEFGEVIKTDFELTKYTNSEGWWSKSDPLYGTMFNGQKTYRGAVAAPRSVPIGSTVIIETEGLPGDVHEMPYEVGDRGSAIVERSDGTLCIDIWVPEDELSEAYKFGRRTANGYVIIPKDSD